MMSSSFIFLTRRRCGRGLGADLEPEVSEVTAHTRKKRGRQPISPDYPRVEVVHDIPEYVLVNKFCDRLPLYHQVGMFARLEVDISWATMSDRALRAAEACQPLVELILRQIRSGPLINMDETTVQVHSEPGRKNISKSYMWVARGGSPGQCLVLFRYAPSRSGEVAEELVGDFKGYLQTYGYAGYKALGRREGIIHVGCLAHVRRKLMEVGKGSENKSGTASRVINLIDKVYHLEKQVRKRQLDPDQIRRLRQKQAKPILDKIKAILDDRHESTPPKNLLGRAIAYARGQLEDGILSPDNNVAENAIRPFMVGRKNWLFSGSLPGRQGQRGSIFAY